jgi:hypothetical protein
MLVGDHRLQRISLRNEQNWKLIEEKQELELLEFQKFEQVLDFDEDDCSSVIDLPSIAFDSGQELSIIDQSTPKAQKTKFLFEDEQNLNQDSFNSLQQYSDVQSNLVKKLFPTKIVRSETSNQIELNELRSRITVH